MGQPPPGESGRPIRRRFAADGRVRSGCSTCKARKKKCDGQISSLDGRCGSCVRLGLVCERLPLRTVANPPPRRRGARRDDEAKGLAISDRDDREAAAAARKSSQSSQSSHFSHFSQYSPSSDSSESSPVPPPPPPPPDGDHDDNANPEDADKVNDDDTTSGHDPVQPPPPSPEQDPGILVCSRPPVPAIPGLTSSIEPVLLRYFLDRVAPLCSILPQDSNAFCSVLIPMAIVDPSLLHALFTYASGHLEAATPGSRATSEARLWFENQVARGVADAINKNNVTETTIASAMVTSTAEVIRGDTSRWLVHHQGAGHLVNHIGASRLLRTADGAFLLQYFAYHDIMASLSTGRRTLVDGVYWVRDAYAPVTSADSFMGLAHHIFRHLVDVCAFVADTADVDYSSCTDLRSRHTLRGEDMAQALRSQDLHLQVDQSDARIQALIHHSEAFRFAGIFFIYRHLLRFSEAGAVYRLRMQDCVRQILLHVAEIPLDMSFEIGLLFPLLMAGVGSGGGEGGGGDADATRYVLERLERIETWTNFKHVWRTRELLQMLWEAGRTDWEVMLRELDRSLSLA